MSLRARFRLSSVLALMVLVAVLAAWRADHNRLVRENEKLDSEMKAKLLEMARVVHVNATTALAATQRQRQLEQQLRQAKVK